MFAGKSTTTTTSLENGSEFACDLDRVISNRQILFLIDDFFLVEGLLMCCLQL